MKERNIALDRFRGLAIILMVIVNDLAEEPAIPGILKHARDIGFTLADLVAPLFIIAIAATYRQSFLRRAAINKGETYVHFIGRYLAILGIGAFFSALSAVVYEPSDWGALQAIGVAGLLTLLVIHLPILARGIIAGVLLVGYQLALNLFLLEEVLGSDHGGLIGAVSWGAMLILGTVMFDIHRKGMKWFAVGTGALSLLAAGSLLLVPISKNRVSLSFVLVSAAISCIVYIAVHLLTKKLPFKSDLIIWWGENPLLLYMLHIVIMAVAALPFMALGIEERPLWLALPVTFVILAVLSFIAAKLHKSGKRISF